MQKAQNYVNQHFDTKVPNEIRVKMLQTLNSMIKLIIFL